MNDIHQELPRNDQDGAKGQDLASTVAGIFQKLEDTSYSSNREIMRTWLEINGDTERRHTKGVHLLEEGLKTLLVYVDSPSIVQDFTMNKHLYLGRFNMADIYIDDIQFRLSRYTHTTNDVSTTNNVNTAHNSTQHTIREISGEEKQYIFELCSALPKNLQEVVSNALISMKSNQWEEDTNNN